MNNKAIIHFRRNAPTARLRDLAARKNPRGGSPKPTERNCRPSAHRIATNHNEVVVCGTTLVPPNNR